MKRGDKPSEQQFPSGCILIGSTSIRGVPRSSGAGSEYSGKDGRPEEPPSFLLQTSLMTLGRKEGQEAATGMSPSVGPSQKGPHHQD